VWHLSLDHLGHVAPKLGLDLGHVLLKSSLKLKPCHVALKLGHVALKLSLDLGHLC
jgi:hypothetical protein